MEDEVEILLFTDDGQTMFDGVINKVMEMPYWLSGSLSLIQAAIRNNSAAHVLVNSKYNNPIYVDDTLRNFIANIPSDRLILCPFIKLEPQ